MTYVTTFVISISLCCCICAVYLMWRGRPGKHDVFKERALSSEQMFPGLARVRDLQLQQQEEMDEEAEDALYREETEAIRRLSAARADLPGGVRATNGRPRALSKLPASRPPAPAPKAVGGNGDQRDAGDIVDFEVFEAESRTVSRLSVARTQSIEAKRAAPSPTEAMKRFIASADAVASALESHEDRARALRALKQQLREFEAGFVAAHGRRPGSADEWGEMLPTFQRYRSLSREARAAKAGAAAAAP